MKQKFRERIKKSNEKIANYCKGKVLDVGCSSGYATNIIHKYFEVTGIDIEEARIIEGKKLHPHLDLRTADFKDFNPKNKYDTIVFVGLLDYHPTNPFTTLEMLGKLLNEKGRIILCVANVRSLKRRIKAILGSEPLESIEINNYRFTRKRIRKLIEKCNYKLLDLTSFNICKFNKINIPTPHNLSEDIVAIIERNEKGITKWTSEVGKSWLLNRGKGDKDFIGN